MRDDEAYALVMLAAILGGVGTGAIYGWEYGVIACGDFEALDPGHPAVLAYRRRWQGDTLYCISNFYPKPCTWTCPEALEGCQVLLSNYPDARASTALELRPYESLVLLRRS